MKRSLPVFFTKVLVAMAVCALLFGVFAPQASALPLSGPHKPTKQQSQVYSAATAPCWGTTCYNKDPFKLGCNASEHEISETIYAADQNYNLTIPVGTIWNAYSYTCNANWAEAEIDYSLVPAGENIYGFTVVIASQDSAKEQQCYPVSPCPYNTGYHGSGIVAWTNMVDGTALATASVNGGCVDCDYAIFGTTKPLTQ